MYNGIFTISLDFELYWGVLDSKPLKVYEKNILGAHEAVREILYLFEKYSIHASWAVLGYLYFENFEELKENLPPLIPTYEQKNFSSYEYFKKLEKLDKRLLFAKDDILNIKTFKFQEIASHTFSHYYCMERGQNKDQFLNDIFYAKKKAKEFGIDLKSIVFPRDQYSKECLSMLKKLGFLAYRGNPNHIIYKPSTQKSKQNIFRKSLLLLDSHFDLTGDNSAKIDAKELPVNIPSSRFLRPVSKNRAVNFLRLRRIKNQMEYAAKNRRLFHLWWHPHNFGINTKKNMRFLEEILIFYKEMEAKYSMLSLSMKEAALYAKEVNLQKVKNNAKDSWILGLSKQKLL